MYPYTFFCFLTMLLEFRVPLPYCVEDPTVGYLYMVMMANLEATGGGEGVKWITNEPYVFIILFFTIDMTTQMVI